MVVFRLATLFVVVVLAAFGVAFALAVLAVLVAATIGHFAVRMLCALRMAFAIAFAFALRFAFGMALAFAAVAVVATVAMAVIIIVPVLAIVIIAVLAVAIVVIAILATVPIIIVITVSRMTVVVILTSMAIIIVVVIAAFGMAFANLSFAVGMFVAFRVAFAIRAAFALLLAFNLDLNAARTAFTAAAEVTADASRVSDDLDPVTFSGLGVIVGNDPNGGGYILADLHIEVDQDAVFGCLEVRHLATSQADTGFFIIGAEMTANSAAVGCEFEVEEEAQLRFWNNDESIAFDFDFADDSIRVPVAMTPGKQRRWRDKRAQQRGERDD